MIKKVIVLFLGLLLGFTIASSATTIDQTGNLLNNGSFETGPSGLNHLIMGHNIPSAADNWNQWDNNGGNPVTTELITHNAIDGNSALYIEAFNWSGVYSLDSYHSPGWDTSRQLTLSGWIYVIEGQAGLHLGSNATGFEFSLSTKIGEWEFLSITKDAGPGVINNEPLLYTAYSPAKFIIDSLWLNYGSSSDHPDATVPEPTTMMLFGIGLLVFAGISRRKK
ncbi:MAG: PEP-CTERM sorting domain-containing protein [Proteobacteria bacterium]|nr:PEP-CTERM sorting domain-containing protein [Pseudomonadota bacterium]MBU1581953.1 PEP-CTERM sorting domain-containing protein [Pseudomonadota bacterium]MBU2453748.1 PEP-CTERM sorting domain-containing protein [Pseudomonadota bacterium]MBU2627880.1 PEP-CTERM sorting domain-containing protein [Pseudomonadota bacterium]